MSANSGIIVFFPIYDQYASIWELDSGQIVYKTYIFFNINLLSYKTWKQN